jgi:hypothetical protein
MPQVLTELFSSSCFTTACWHEDDFRKILTIGDFFCKFSKGRCKNSQFKQGKEFSCAVDLGICVRCNGSPEYNQDRNTRCKSGQVGIGCRITSWKMGKKPAVCQGPSKKLKQARATCRSGKPVPVQRPVFGDERETRWCHCSLGPILSPVRRFALHSVDFDS